MSDALGSEVWMYAGLRSELNHIVFLFFVVVVIYIIITVIFQCRRQFCDGKSHGHVVRIFNFF